MKISTLTIVVLSLTLVTIIGWLSYSLFRVRAASKTINQVEEKYTRPLQPSFDDKLLEDLKAQSN